MFSRLTFSIIPKANDQIFKNPKYKVSFLNFLKLVFELKGFCRNTHSFHLTFKTVKTKVFKKKTPTSAIYDKNLSIPKLLKDHESAGLQKSHKTKQKRQQFTQTWFSLLRELQEKGKSAFESCRDLNELVYFKETKMFLNL